MNPIILRILDILQRLDERVDNIGRDSSSSWCGPPPEQHEIQQIRYLLAQVEKDAVHAAGRCDDKYCDLCN